jgi:23S rRNA (guanosine2251-2'-O)-methyltransferase
MEFEEAERVLNQIGQIPISDTSVWRRAQKWGQRFQVEATAQRAIATASPARGVHGAILPQRRGVEVTLAVVNASSGASEHLRIARVVNLVRAMEALKERGVWIAGLEHKDERSVDFWSADLRSGLALVIGNESEGLRRLVRQTCDYLLKIPMRGHIESLNASIAGSIVLYEVLRQRRAAQTD